MTKSKLGGRAASLSPSPADRRIVAVRPPGAFPGSTLLRNGFFGGTYTHVGVADHWLKPYAALQRRAAETGLDLITEDLADLDRAAALVTVDIPSSALQLNALRVAHPRLKLILQTIESVSGRLWTVDPANHRLFDAVISYDDRHRGLPGYFIHKIPAGGLDGWPGPLREDRWEDRRLACMVVSCQSTPPRIPRRTGLGMLRMGWKLTPKTWWNYVSANNSLNSARIEVAVALAQAAPEAFDLFGLNWIEMGPSAATPSVRGPTEGSKLDFLGKYRFNIAFENCRNRCGYISEKIFDALLAGAVPVYLGNEDIGRYVPAEAFVDARAFSSYADLARFLMSMPEKQWTAMRDAGAHFLRHDALTHFGEDQYVQAALAAIKFSLDGPPNSPAGGVMTVAGARF